MYRAPVRFPPAEPIRRRVAAPTEDGIVCCAALPADDAAAEADRGTLSSAASAASAAVRARVTHRVRRRRAAALMGAWGAAGVQAARRPGRRAAAGKCWSGWAGLGRRTGAVGRDSVSAEPISKRENVCAVCRNENTVTRNAQKREQEKRVTGGGGMMLEGSSISIYGWRR